MMHSIRKFLVRRDVSMLTAAAILMVAFLGVRAVAQEGSGPSGVLKGDGLFLEWRVVGAEVGAHFYRDRTWQAPGAVTSTKVRFSGVMRASVPRSLYTDASMSAYISLPMGADKKEVKWRGELNGQGPEHELAFDLVLEVPVGRPVLMAASVGKTGGTTDLLAVFFQFDGAKAPLTAPAEVAQPSNRPLCPEALTRFPGFASRPPIMRYDYAGLQNAFNDAIRRYADETNRRPTVHDNLLGTLPAISWLFTEGSLLGEVAGASDFVFVTAEERSKWQNGIPTTNAGLSPGNEVYFYNSIYEAAKAAKRKLTLSDVIYLALKQRNGEMKEAMLLAHNTFRSLARYRDNAILGAVGMRASDREFTLVSHSPDFIAENIEPLLDPPPQGQDQNNGALYHLFGTAYFEMQARGSIGENMVFDLAWDSSMDQVHDQIETMRKVLKQDPQLTSPANMAVYSRAANLFEQWYRTRKGAQDDPWKFCYNIYGAQIGSWLYRERLLQKGLPVDTRPSGGGFINTPLNGAIYAASSPVDIRWTGSGKTLSLDQAAQNLSGDFPIAVLPFSEADTRTWGLIWADLGDAPYRLSLQATQDGWAHLTRLDSGKGRLVYPIALRKGARFDLTVDPRRPDAPLVDERGVEIRPLQIGDDVRRRPVPPPPPPPPTEVGVLFDNWNSAACVLTDIAVFRLDARARVTAVELWYKWAGGETIVPFRLAARGSTVVAGQLRRTSCDPQQPSWCTAAATVDFDAPAGWYGIQVERRQLCGNAKSQNNGFIRVRGAQ